MGEVWPNLEGLLEGTFTEMDGARLVATPGCYPTAAALAILRLTPPLIVSEDEVERALGLIERALYGDRPCSGPGGVGASPTSGGA